MPKAVKADSRTGGRAVGILRHSKNAEIDAMLDRVVVEGRLDDLKEAIANGRARRALHPDSYDLLIERINEMFVRWRMDADTSRN